MSSSWTEEVLCMLLLTISLFIRPINSWTIDTTRIFTLQKSNKSIQQKFGCRSSTSVTKQITWRYNCISKQMGRQQTFFNLSRLLPSIQTLSIVKSWISQTFRQQIARATVHSMLNNSDKSKSPDATTVFPKPQPIRKIQAPLASSLTITWGGTRRLIMVD